MVRGCIWDIQIWSGENTDAQVLHEIRSPCSTSWDVSFPLTLTAHYNCCKNRNQSWGSGAATLSAPQSGPLLWPNSHDITWTGKWKRTALRCWRCLHKIRKTSLTIVVLNRGAWALCTPLQTHHRTQVDWWTNVLDVSSVSALKSGSYFNCRPAWGDI